MRRLLKVCSLLLLAFLFTSPSAIGQGSVLELDVERDITVNGIDPLDVSGNDVASGDINHDGVADLIIGGFQADPGGRSEAGETYVFFGPLVSGTLEISDADVTVNGIDPVDRSGIGVASGDVNADGVDDLIIGAYFADPQGRTQAGETYVLFGPLTTGIYEISAEVDITINGIDRDDRSGVNVATGDVNNDGKTDLIIGAERADPGGRVDAGETYVLFGPVVSGTLELSDADITLNGIAFDDLSGEGLAAGDLNNDGMDDVVVGAPSASPIGKGNAGEAYILFGPLARGTYEISARRDITVNAIDAGDAAGNDVATGDVNNDGFDDLIVGGYLAHGGGRADSGETYVLFGPLRRGTYDLSTNSDIVYNGIRSGDSSGQGVGAGDINDDGITDVIIGAGAADPFGRDRAGETYVLFGPVGPTPPPGTPTPTPTPGPTPEEIEELIEKFFPIFHFSKDERFLPTNFYFDGDLDVNNNATNYDLTSHGGDNTVYIRAVQTADHLVVEYWLYYAYNPRSRAGIGHHHDWERVDVVLNIAHVAANGIQPEFVRYAQHFGGVICNWPPPGGSSECFDAQDPDDRSEGALTLEDGRAPVFVARDSHASYPNNDMRGVDSGRFRDGGEILQADDFENWILVTSNSHDSDSPHGHQDVLFPHPQGCLSPDFPPESRQFAVIDFVPLKGQHPSPPIPCPPPILDPSLWPEEFDGGPFAQDLEAPWHRTQDWDNGSFVRLLPNSDEMMVVQVGSPIQFRLIDPLGRVLGQDRVTGEIVLNIPDAIFIQGEDETDPSLAIIMSPIQGEYQVEVQGTGSGTYNLQAVSTIGSVVSAQLTRTDVPIIENEVQINILEVPTPQRITDSLRLDGLDTSYNPGDGRAPGGVFTITATFTNVSQSTAPGGTLPPLPPESFFDVFFKVKTLTGDNQVLNCDGGPGGVGCNVSVPPAALGPDEILSPGESFTQAFEIGLGVRARFDFFVDAFGIPLP